eukprot:5636606-Pleurochrysis_carterae.AAC.1
MREGGKGREGESRQKRGKVGNAGLSARGGGLSREGTDAQTVSREEVEMWEKEKRKPERSDSHIQQAGERR